jgi:two-component system phosphate regulon response regulator PhoB
VRNIVFRFDDSPSFALVLREGDQELGLPVGERASDGEWVLAIFEIGEKRRATAAAARGVQQGPDSPALLSFERRDWERLVTFAETETETEGTSKPPPASSNATPTQPSPSGDVEAAISARGSVPKAAATPSFAHWRGSDPFTQGPHARILLVDDDRDIREVVGAMLDAVGLTVESSTSAEEALERVRADSYDLLVLDWNLPGMTGVELCRLIRRDAKLAALPILFLTAHSSSGDVVEAFASGADDYVAKPFRAPELGARIFGLLRRARMAPAAF